MSHSQLHHGKSKSNTSNSKSKSSSSQSIPPTQNSKFRTCLNDISVPEKLQSGVKVLKIYSNGKTKNAFLTLSQDKFTIYVTTTKFKDGKTSRGGIIRPMLKKVTSIGSNDGDDDIERAIDIGNIVRIHRGQNTLRFEQFRKQKRKNKISSPKKIGSLEFDGSLSFSIFFIGGRTLDLVVTDEDETIERDTIIDVFERLVHAYSRAKLRVGDDVLLLRYIWLDVDKDKSDTINSAELATILNRINYSMKRSESDQFYEKFAKMIGLDKSERRNGISFEQCVLILHKVKRDSTWQVKPVQQIFFDLFGEFMNKGTTRTRVSNDSFLRKFMLKKQGETNTTLQDVESIFRRLNDLEVADVVSNLHLEESLTGKFIDKDRFESYLVSAENNVFDPEKAMFKPETMDRPISEYWISSSHNTYLSGDQWKDPSSVEMYVTALNSGCRCLELDCWDGEMGAEQSPIPVIFHGHTMTAKILFSDVIEAIKVFLNGNPDCFPIILSLENHCSIPYERAMADCMIEVFGDSLFIPDENSLQKKIPTPNSLRGRVLLKGNRMASIQKDSESIAESDTDTDSDDDSEVGDEHGLKDEAEAPLKLKHSNRVTKKGPMDPELSRITYFDSVSLKNFEESQNLPPNQMHSFSETRTRKYCGSNQRNDWVQYNRTHITRTYPSGRRLDSSNFNPIAGWSTGSQLVALNLQTSDPFLRLNHGRFLENGNCGYILKPQSLLSADVPRPEPLTAYIKVLCGYCLPKPGGGKRGKCIDPYVHTCLFDVPARGGKEIVRGSYTQPVPNNGFNPIWNQTDDTRFQVQNPDVAMLQFTVWDKDVGGDDFIASSSIPVSCIREGYRSVKLFDARHTRNGPFECASLLVEVRFKRKGDVKVPMW